MAFFTGLAHSKSSFPWLWRLSAVGLALVLGGCGHPVQRQLEGRWFGEGAENYEQRQLSAVTGWARGVWFEFSGDTLTLAVPAAEPRSGRYQVASVHKSDVRLVVHGPSGERDTLRLKIDDERSVRWMIDETHSVVLRRED